MTLDAKKAKQYLENKVAKGLRIDVKRIKHAEKAVEIVKRHDKISTYDPKQSIPVILQTLLEITNKLPGGPAASAGVNNNNQPPDELAATRALLQKAIEVFSETDENQNTNLIVLGAKFALTDKFTKENITKGLKELVDGAQNIVVTPDTEALWEECSIWLQGLYRRTYDKMPLDKDGQPQKGDDGGYVISFRSKDDHSTIDGDDKKFKGLVGLTKMDISQYYHDASAVIDQKLAIFRNGLGAGIVAPAPMRDSSKNTGEAIVESRPSLDGKAIDAKPAVINPADNKSVEIKPVAAAALVQTIAPVPVVAAGPVPVLAVGDKFVTEVDNTVRLGFDILNATPEIVTRLREDKELEVRLRKLITAALLNQSVSDLSSSKPALEPLRAVMAESPVAAVVETVQLVPAASASIPAHLPSQEVPSDANKLDLTTLLNKFLNGNEEVKMKALRYGLEVIGLSEAQRALLMSLQEDAVKQLNVYINRNNWLDYFKKPTNWAEATKAVEDIRATEDPKDMLVILMDLRNKLEPLHSTGLKPIVAKVLNDNYTLLSTMEFNDQKKMSMATVAVDNRSMPALYVRK